MQNFTIAQATALVKKHTINNANKQTAQAIQTALANKIANALNSNSATFANVTQVTQVKLSAANAKTHNIVKLVKANVTLNANFTNSVNKSANTTNFVAQASVNNTTAFNNCVKHNANTNNYLLYVTYNKVQSSCYYCVNTQQFVSKQYVASLLTASASAKLLSNNNTTHNVKNDVTHSVQVRTIALQNVMQLNVNKQQLTS